MYTRAILIRKSFDIVNKCSAINCRSGYTGENTDPNITFHSFPLQNQPLLKIWLKRLARKDFTPTKYSRLCSLHFTSDDFSDQNSRREKRRNCTLAKRRLQKDACPSIFKNLPTYYMCDDAAFQSGLSEAKTRREKEALKLE